MLRKARQRGIREVTGWLIIVLLVGSVAGFAWLTRHPDAPWLERAEEWPGVGPLAQSFRRAYLGPPESERRASRDADAEPEVIVVGGPRPGEPLDLRDYTGPLGRQASAGATASRADAARERPRGESPAAAGPDLPSPTLDIPSLVAVDGPVPRIRRIFERRWLLPGTVLRADPAAGAAEVERAHELASVPVLGRDGEWLRVQLRGREGWADPASPAYEARPPGRRALNDRHLARPPTDLLREVKELLGLRRPNRSLGPYAVYTDVEDEAVLELLDGVAGRLGEAYGARYGLGVPRRRSGPVIALFADQADYEVLVRSVSTPHEHPNGFAVGGLAIFFVGDRPRQTLVTTFVHELTHTLNRQAIGSGLPLWIEEGMASDLGAVWIEDPDAPAPGLVDAAVDRGQWRPQRILMAGEVTPVIGSYELLTTLPRSGFYDGTGVGHRHSLLFIRCLLDGGDDELAEGFQRFLFEAAGGYRPTPERLLDRLGRDWTQIGDTCVDHRRALQAETRRLLPAEWIPAAAR